MYPISKVLLLNLTLVFKNSQPKSQHWAFCAKQYQLFNLNEILPVSCFEGDFKSDILSHYQLQDALRMVYPPQH